jgi:hypothetical protein
LLDNHDRLDEGFTFLHLLDDPSRHIEKPATCSVPGPTPILHDSIHRRNLLKMFTCAALPVHVRWARLPIAF